MFNISILSDAACHSYEKPRCSKRGGYVRGWDKHVSGSHREARNGAKTIRNK